jgi:hypothetical protein
VLAQAESVAELPEARFVLEAFPGGIGAQAAHVGEHQEFRLVRLRLFKTVRRFMVS